MSSAMRSAFLALAAFAAAIPAVAAEALDDRSGAQKAGDARKLSQKQLRQEARQIHLRAIALDSHVDIAGTYYATQRLDPGVDDPRLRCNLVKMAAGGVDGVFLAAWIGQGKCDAEGYRRARATAHKKIEAIRRLATVHADRCELAGSPADVLRIAKSGKRAIVIAVENGYPIGTDPSNLEELFDLGVRCITLCHNGHNQICDSANPRRRLGDRPAKHNGLSQLGKRVLERMNELGIIVDVSHLAPKSFYDVIEQSDGPVIASHSGCRAVNDHPRNLDDRQLKALAAGGGVIQVVAVGSFLRTPSAQRRRAIAELAKEIGIPTDGGNLDFGNTTDRQRSRFADGFTRIDARFPVATIEDYVDHIEHAVKVAGMDHVGIGSDFDGGGGVPGFDNHAQAMNVTIELLRRGYGEQAVAKIWGGNLLRVWREVDGAAAKLRSGR